MPSIEDVLLEHVRDAYELAKKLRHDEHKHALAMQAVFLLEDLYETVVTDAAPPEPAAEAS